MVNLLNFKELVSNFLHEQENVLPLVVSQWCETHNCLIY